MKMLEDPRVPNVEDNNKNDVKVTSCGKIQAVEGSTGYHNSFEDVFVAMGPPGLYQVFQIAMIMTTQIPQAFVYVKYVFISLTPSYRCSQINETEYFGKILKTPNDAASYYASYNESCEIDILKNVSGTLQTLQKLDCINGYDYDGGKDVSFITEWDLVCDKEGLPELAQTAVSVGKFAGLILFNVIADKYGRWITTTISICLTATTEIATCYATDIYTLLAIRFLTGFANSGMMVTSFIMCLEMITSEYREIFVMISGCTWSLCIAFLSGLAYALRNSNWREFQFYTSLICLFPLLLVYFINESASWLHSVGDKQKAERIIQQACKINRIDYLLVKDTFEECFKNNDRKKTSTSDEREVKDNIIMLLFKSKNVLKIVVIAIFSYFTIDMTANGLYLIASSLVGSIYLNMAIIAFTGVPACCISWVLLKFKGRRFVIVFMLVMTAICLPISGSIQLTNIDRAISSKLSVALFVLGHFAITACYNTIFMFIPESFPTNIRASAAGISYAGSSIGGCLAPYLSPLQKIASWAPGTCLSACCLTISVLLFMLPETKGKQLESTLKQESTINEMKADSKHHPVERKDLEQSYL